MPTFRLSRRQADYWNERNICYINAALQLMASISVLKEFSVAKATLQPPMSVRLFVRLSVRLSVIKTP